MGPTSPCVAFTFLPGFCIPPCVTRNESCAIGEGREFSWHGFSSVSCIITEAQAKGRKVLWLSWLGHRSASVVVREETWRMAAPIRIPCLCLEERVDAITWILLHNRSKIHSPTDNRQRKVPNKFRYLLKNLRKTDSINFSSVAQLCLTLCDPMNCSTPGLPVHHQLPELTQTHIHRVSDAIQSSHPLLSPSPPAPNPSQHQSLFQWVNFSHEVAKVRLEFQL